MAPLTETEHGDHTMLSKMTPSEWTAVALATAMTLGPLVPYGL
jgi:hypothetical protein